MPNGRKMEFALTGDSSLASGTHLWFVGGMMYPLDVLRTPTDMDWANFKVLKKEGPWMNFGDADVMSWWILNELDRACAHLNLKPLVTSGAKGKHSKNSWHYPVLNGEHRRPGCAIDFMLPAMTRAQLPDVLVNLMRFDFKGIGIYSEWRLSAGGKPLGGFHVEWNDKDQRALWLRSGQGDFPITYKNLQRFFLLGV
jgi:hypothetical protein